MSEQTKHTPGKWVVLYTSRGVPVVCCEGPDGGTIARCNTNKSPEENKANAELCAAAPDLLHACKAFLSVSKTCGYDCEQGRVMEAQKLAEEAIARAESRQPAEAK